MTCPRGHAGVGVVVSTGVVVPEAPLVVVTVTTVVVLPPEEVPPPVVLPPPGVELVPEGDGVVVLDAEEVVVDAAPPSHV